MIRSIFPTSGSTHSPNSAPADPASSETISCAINNESSSRYASKCRIGPSTPDSPRARAPIVCYASARNTYATLLSNSGVVSYCNNAHNRSTVTYHV